MSIKKLLEAPLILYFEPEYYIYIMDYALANPMETTSVPIEHRFEPYDDNGG